MRVTASFTLLFVSGALFGLGGCTTSPPGGYPDAHIVVDVGMDDAGPVDGGYPTPSSDPCMRGDGGTLGQTCADNSQCDDHCYCNGVESCSPAGVCVAGVTPCTDAVDCTEEACLEEIDRCFNMPNHMVCSNHVACDGYEQCDPQMGCVPGNELYCNDESSCTFDSCDNDVGCVFTPRDLDMDGYLSGLCGGDDCDDDFRYGGNIHPGVAEDCYNRRDDNCDGRRDFSDDGCLPSNDTCATAQLLPERSGTYSGSSEGLRFDYAQSCTTGSSGADAVFRLDLTAMHDVRLAVSGLFGGAVVSIRNWNQCAAGPDLRCVTGGAPSLLRRSLPMGSYAIIVRTPSSGPFDISLTLSDPTPVPLVDVCDASTETISASGTYRGRFEETVDDYRLTCHPGTAGFRDAAYRLHLDADSDVMITGSTSGEGTFAAYVAISSDCADTMQMLSCQFGSPVDIRRRGMVAGDYYILVESTSADAIDWTLNVTITSPPVPRQPGDACETAAPITLSGDPSGPMTGSATAMLAGAELDSGTSCGGATAGNRDVYFLLHLDTTRDVTVTTNSAGGFHFFALSSECGAIGHEIRCRSGSGTLNNQWRSLDPGDYWITVATGIGSGNVTANVETRPPTPIPPNDRCGGALTLVGPSTSFTGHTLIGFEDDIPGCTGSGFPDAFYTFTLAASQRVIISASATAMQRIYLSLRTTCAAGAAVPMGCVNGAGSATINTVLGPGTYSLQVEMSAAEASDFGIFYTELPP